MFKICAVDLLFHFRSMKELFKLCKERTKIKYRMTVSDLQYSMSSLVTFSTASANLISSILFVCHNWFPLFALAIVSIVVTCLQVNMVEVYNEAIYDLLAAPEDFHEKLSIQKKGKDIIVPVSEIKMTVQLAVWFSCCVFVFCHFIIVCIDRH